MSRLHKKTSGIDCTARTVTEAELHTAVVKAVNEVFAKKDDYLVQLRENISKALDNSSKLAELDNQIGVLEHELIRLTKTKQDSEDLGKEILGLREEAYRLRLEDAEKEGQKRKVEDLEKFLVGGEVEEYDEALVRRLVERIMISDDKIMV